MKTLLLIACLFITGCTSITGSATASDAAYISTLLDKVLPADFSGAVHVEHKNPYFDFTIDAGGLHRTDKGWTWVWLKYHRSGRFSEGRITLGTPAP